MPGPYHNPALSDQCSRARVNSRRQGLRSQLLSAGSVCVCRGRLIPSPTRGPWVHGGVLETSPARGRRGLVET